MATVRDLLAEARRALASAAFGPSRREAALLLARALGTSETRLLAFDEREVPVAAEARFRSWLERRLAGEPVAYLTGEREFWGRPFFVDRRVLVPRPESEHLVEAALDLPLAAAPRLLDLGTGSGCLAVTLALEVPAAHVVAVDASLGALAVADANRRRHGVADRVALLASDWTAALDLRRCDLVVANPPYLDPAVAPRLSPEVREHEPPSALFAEQGGLAAFGDLLAAARGARVGTPLLVEIGDHQRAELETLARRLGWTPRGSRRDLAGHERVVLLERGLG